MSWLLLLKTFFNFELWFEWNSKKLWERVIPLRPMHSKLVDRYFSIVWTCVRQKAKLVILKNSFKAKVLIETMASDYLTLPKQLPGTFL